MRKSGTSTRFVLALAAVYSLLILALSFTFQFFLDRNANILTEILVKNSNTLLLQRAESVLDLLNREKPRNPGDLAAGLRKSFARDDMLYIIIFSKTPDDNYFKVVEKVPLSPLMKIDLQKNASVQENKEINYLREGLFRGTTDPGIYCAGGTCWQNVYAPIRIGNRDYVVEFMFPASRTRDALGEYSSSLKEGKVYIIAVTVVILIVIFILIFLFQQNFALLIKNLSSRMKKAAGGELDVGLNPGADMELNELALSFNSLLEEMKGLKEKEKRAKELEGLEILNDLFRTGVNLIKEARFEHAVPLFKTLTILKPDAFGSYFNLGVAYAKTGDYESSLAMFDRALLAKPGHALTINYIEKVKRLKSAHENTVERTEEQAGTPPL